MTFYSQREEYIIRLLEHKKGIKMQRIGPPQPADVVRAAAADAAKQLDHVHQDSIDAFVERARELIVERGAEVALAATLAALTGHTRRLRGRSLLSAFEGYTACMLESERDIEQASKGWYLLRQMVPEDIVRNCKGLVCCKGNKKCIFDVPDDMVPRLLKAKLWRGVTISVAKEFPELEERSCNLNEAAAQLRDRNQYRWQKIQERKSAEKADRAERDSGGRGGAGVGRGRGLSGRGGGALAGGGGRGGRTASGGSGGRRPFSEAVCNAGRPPFREGAASARGGRGRGSRGG